MNLYAQPKPEAATPKVEATPPPTTRPREVDPPAKEERQERRRRTVDFYYKGTNLIFKFCVFVSLWLIPFALFFLSFD